MGILIEFSMGGLVLESGPLLVCVRYAGLEEGHTTTITMPNGTFVDNECPRPEQFDAVPPVNVVGSTIYQWYILVCAIGFCCVPACHT